MGRLVARGLGTALTAACLDVAREWGLGRGFAETSTENTRMLRAFRALGFALAEENGVVRACLDLRRAG